MKYSKDLLWTRLTIEILDEVINSDDFIFCTRIVQNFEQKYSRFIEWNFLSKLNENKYSEIEREFYSILKLCEKISVLSQWFFDITILPFLENAWYGIKKEKIQEAFWFKNIVLESHQQWNTWEDRYLVTLKNSVSIEIGSVGKWFLIDMISTYLEKKYTNFIIDFWWDIKVIWNINVQLENPSNKDTPYGFVHLNNCSIASSNWIKRQFEWWHHLVNKHKKLELWEEKTTLFILHKSSAISDIIATALFVSPLNICKEIIAQVPWVEVYMLFEDGRIFQTPWFILLHNK